MKAGGAGSGDRREKPRRGPTDGWMDGQRRGGEENNGEVDAGTTAWTGGIYTPNRIPAAAATAHMAARDRILHCHYHRRSSGPVLQSRGGRRFKIASPHFSYIIPAKLN